MAKKEAAAPSPSSPTPPSPAGPLRNHWLRLRTTCQPTEDPAKVEGALRFAAGVEETEFREGFTDEPIASHHGGTVRLMEVSLERSRAVRDILQRVFGVPGAREALASTAEPRTDEDGVFYFRLGKQEAAQGRLALTQGEDAIQARLRMEAYPATREAALAAVRQLLGAPRP
jgi:RNA binding exosome subunit